MARHDPRPVKITFGEMRSSGVRGVMVYCTDYKCSHSIATDASLWSDDLRLTDVEQRFVCKALASEALMSGPTSNRPAWAPDDR